MKAFINAKLVYPDKIEDGVLLTERGKILACGPMIPPMAAEVVDVKGAYLGPGLVDIHCHGYVGKETLECYDGSENPHEMAMGHLKNGTTSITPSFSYSLRRERFLEAIIGCKDAMNRKDTTILGMHFEGPFTNPCCGGAGYAWDFTEEDFNVIFDAAKENVLHCTYSPEMPWALRLEALLKERGVVMDIGHTCLSSDDAFRAVSNGAKIVTHLFDAMGCWRGSDSVMETGVLQDSADTVLLSMPGLFYELICDSQAIHVKKSNLHLVRRIAGEDGIILVTDCTTKRRYDPKRYPKNHCRSIEDLNFTKKGLLNGSCLTLSEACRNYKNQTGATIRELFKCASTNPAKAIKRFEQVGSILPGRDANLLVVDQEFQVLKVFLRGEEIVTIDAPKKHGYNIQSK